MSWEQHCILIQRYTSLFILWIVSHHWQTRAVLHGNAAWVLKTLWLLLATGADIILWEVLRSLQELFSIIEQVSLFLWIINFVFRLIFIFRVGLLKKSIFYQVAVCISILRTANVLRSTEHSWFLGFWQLTSEFQCIYLTIISCICYASQYFLRWVFC